VELVLRLDSSAQNGGKAKATPKRPASESAIVSEREQLFGAVGVFSDEGVGKDDTVIKYWVVPDSVSIERNNLYTADRCTVNVAYKNMPFDPRQFRAAAIRVVIGAPSSSDYAKGVSDGSFDINTTPSIVAKETTEWYSLSGNSRFVGFVDEWQVDFDDKGENVQLQCRDISSILRDEELPESAGIDLDKPLLIGVTEMVRRFPALQDVLVVYGNPVFQMGTKAADDMLKIMSKQSEVHSPIPRGTVDSITADLTVTERKLQVLLTKSGVKGKLNGEDVTFLPKLKNGLIDADVVQGAVKKTKVEAAPPPKPGAKVKKKTVKPKADKKIKMWDHILDICTKMALVPIMRGHVLYLADARGIYSSRFGLRQMVWGGNISSLKIARKSRNQDDAGKGIQLICPVARLGRRYWARFPVPKGDPSSGILGKAGSPQPVNTREVAEGEDPNEDIESSGGYQTLVMSGINSEKHLVAVAEALYDRMCRQELEVAIETSDLSSFSNIKGRFDTTTESADLLELSPGDAIQIETLNTIGKSKPSLLEKGQYRPNNFLDISAMSRGEREDFYISRGFSGTVAKRLSGSQDFGEIHRTFRVNHASISWSAGEGVSISMDAINFIEAVTKDFEATVIDQDDADPALRALDLDG
jgi:hypothetical protein